MNARLFSVAILAASLSLLGCGPTGKKSAEPAKAEAAAKPEPPADKPLVSPSRHGFCQNVVATTDVADRPNFLAGIFHGDLDTV